MAKNKKIGEGTEGICFRYGNEIYKIYKKLLEEPKTKIFIEPQYDSDGVRIYKKEDFRNVKYSNNPNRLIKYITQDGTVLHNEQALNIAIDRGHKIVGTKIPQKIIYVNGVARGCVYPYYRFTKSIYSAYRKTFKKRLKICRMLLNKVQELIDNNIYPVDLCQKGINNLYDKNYANVLLNYKNEPILIDLDGKSALYSEVPNELYNKHTCTTLSNLIFEILTREDIQEDYNDEDYDAIRQYLTKAGLTDELVERFLENEMSMEDISESIDLMERNR